jgi:hypothetical protein
LVNAHEFSDQAFAATLAHGVKLSYSVAFAKRFGTTLRKPTAPVTRVKLCARAVELWPVGTRQAKKLADHRNRQLSRL